MMGRNQYSAASMTVRTRKERAGSEGSSAPHSKRSSAKKSIFQKTRSPVAAVMAPKSCSPCGVISRLKIREVTHPRKDLGLCGFFQCHDAGCWKAAGTRRLSDETLHSAWQSGVRLLSPHPWRRYRVKRPAGQWRRCRRWLAASRPVTWCAKRRQPEYLQEDLHRTA